MNRFWFQIASNVLLLWAMGLITYTTIIMLHGDWETINVPMATIHGSTVGILATVTGYVQKRIADMCRDEHCSRSSK